MSTFRSIVVSQHGGPEVLALQERRLGELRPGMVRVRVLATGVAFADVLMRRGLYPGAPPPPFTPGYDVAGTVTAVGPGVAGMRPGQRVAALTVTGGYSDYLDVAAERLVPLPETVDPAEAVSVVLNYLTAYQMLHRVYRQLAPGRRVLVHAAAGGVGTALLQLGRLAGAELFGTASAGKHALLRAEGATPIDYRSEDVTARVRALAPGGVDLVLDAIGGPSLYRSYRLLRPGGMLISYGVTGTAAGARSILGLLPGILPTFLLRWLPGRRVAWYDIAAMVRRRPDWYRQDLEHLLGLLSAGSIRPVVAERLPLHEAARAHALLEGSSVSGKLVLVTAPSGGAHSG